MKSSFDEKRAFIVLLILLGCAFLVLLKPMMIALSLAIIMTILVNPVYLFWTKIFRGKRYLASFITTLLIFLILILPLTIIVALLVNQALGVLSQLDVEQNFSSLSANAFYQHYLLPLTESFTQKTGIQLDLAKVLTQFGKEAIHYIYSYSPQVLGRTATVIFSFFVMHFSIYFLFIEGPTVVQVILDLSPIKKKYQERLALEFKRMIDATVYGYLLTALVQATLAGIGFWIAGVRFPLVFATLTFFMSMVPIVGATSVWLPITVWYLAQGHISWAIFLGLYGALVISGIDNIIKPWIMQGKAQIHLLLIFFSLLGGLQLFGPIGILFGPIITALFLACIRIYREDYLPREPLESEG